MRFKIIGEFETETLIELAQRAAAQLQDAGVERVAGVNIYLSVVDRKGVMRSLSLGDEPVEQITLDCGDLALERAAPRLELSRQPYQSRKGPSPKKRGTR